MKKIVTAMGVAIAASLSIVADTETVGEYTWTYRIDGEGAVIHGVYDESSYSYLPAASPRPQGEVAIPSTLGDKPVIRIGENAFDYCRDLTSVTIPDSVTNIEPWAFRGCSSLADVTIPGDVTNIGAWAFCDCSSLTNVTIPSRVTSIGQGAFHGCSGLADENGHVVVRNVLYSYHGEGMDVVIPENVSIIDDYAFEGQGGLTSVTIPGSVTNIGEGAFYACSSLTNVTIPSSVASVGDWAFSECDALSYDSQTVPGVKVVDGWAFDYEPDLSGDVDLTGVRGIVGGAFGGCSGITGVRIPNGVASIGNSTFQECLSLTNAVIPNSITHIGEYAFSDCGLISVTIPVSVTSIGDKAFSYCANLTVASIPQCLCLGSDSEMNFTGAGFEYVTNLVINDGVTNIGENAFCDCSCLASVTIPNSVTDIGDGAFSGCSGLTSVTIPSSVTNIGYGAFHVCNNLADAYLPKALEGTFDFYDVFYDYDTTTVHYYSGVEPTCCTVTLNVNGGVELSETNIAVVVGETIGSLPEPTHSDATLGFMGWFTAAEGGALVISRTAVSSNATVYAHWGAEQSELYYCVDEDVDGNLGVWITEDTIDGYSGLSGDLVIPSRLAMEIGGDECYSLPVVGIDDYAFGGTVITSVDIPNGVTSIGESVFSDCENLTSVVIPASVTNIGEYAFGSCYGLTNVFFLGNAPIIGDGCFYAAGSGSDVGICTAYVKRNSTGWGVRIPGIRISYLENTEVVGGYTWYYDVYGDVAEVYDVSPAPVGSITIPSMLGGYPVTSIGSYMFNYSDDDGDALISVTIPTSVTNIGEYAFYYCSGLTSMTIPESVTNIGECAFYGCSGLTSLTIPESVTKIGEGAFNGC